MRGIRLLAVFILIVFSSSVVHAGFHHHHDNNSKNNCSICVFSSNLSNGDSQSTFSLIIEHIEFAVVKLQYKNHLLLTGSCNLTLTRAPPISFF